MLSHFNQTTSLRIVCDARHEGLCAILMQKDERRDWEPISCSWSSFEDQWGEEIEVMHIDNRENSANKPFLRKGTFNRMPFHALMDTGSPVTIFTKAHTQKMFGKDYKLQPLEKNVSTSIPAAIKSSSLEPSSGKSSRERKS